MDETTKIAIFKGKKVRKTIHKRSLKVNLSSKLSRFPYNNEWWFVVEDAVLALTDSSDPKQYVNRMKQRDLELSKGWVQIVHTLSIKTEGGKQNYIGSPQSRKLIEKH